MYLYCMILVHTHLALGKHADKIFFFFLTLSSTKPRLGSEGKIDDQLVNYMLGAWDNTKGIWPYLYVGGYSADGLGFAWAFAFHYET